MATILKYSSKRGTDIVNRAIRYEGTQLHQVYEKWSQAKQAAFDECYDKYLATPDHDSWGICSHTNNFFTVSWLGKYEEQDALFYETHRNSYIVIFDK